MSTNLGYINKVPWTRLTPNANGWVKPSGRFGKCHTQRLFEGWNGFGFEEWLFNQEHCVDGWQFGYLQAFKEPAQGGLCFPVLDLITRVCCTVDALERCNDHSPSISDGFYSVARITEVRSLTDAEAAAVVDYAGAQGWLDRMRSELAADQRKTFNDHLQKASRNIFNVMFKREDTAVPQARYASLSPWRGARTQTMFQVMPQGNGQVCPPREHRIFK
jgi:hypothetical protein